MAEEVTTQLQGPPELMEGTPVHKAEPVKASKPHIILRSQVPVDEEHPVVIELLDLGYELEQCIRAAELHPEDATAAQEYLMDVGEKGNLFKGVLMESSPLHAETEMPLEKPAFEQQENSKSTFHEERYVKICFKYIYLADKNIASCVLEFHYCSHAVYIPLVF